MKVKVFTGFQFVPKKQKRKRTPHNKRYSKLVYCVCGQDENGYYALVNLPNNRKINFTKASFSLKDRLVVFSHKLDENGKPICVYRTERTAKHDPGAKSQYTPFCKDYIYSGYIVKNNGELQFDMHELVGAYSLHNNLMKDRITLYEH